MAVAVAAEVEATVCFRSLIAAFTILIHGLDYGSYSGGGSGAGSSSFRDDNRRAGGFEEYNAGDDEVVTTSPVRSNSISAGRAHARKASAPAPAPAPVQEVDLLGGFGDDDPFGSTSTAAKGFATDKALPAVGHVPMATQQPSVGIDGKPIRRGPRSLSNFLPQMMTLTTSKLHRSRTSLRLAQNLT